MIDEKTPEPSQKKPAPSVMQQVFSPESAMQGQGQEKEDVSKIVREWLSPKHITRKTRYSKKQTIAISILQSLANTYKIKTLQRFLQEFRTSKLSEEGKSSEELVDILQSRLPSDEDVELKNLARFLE
jgi:hypothetical protein